MSETSEMNINFLLDCLNFKKLREFALKSIQDTDLNRGNIIKKFREQFSNGSLRLLCVLGKFV